MKAHDQQLILQLLETVNKAQLKELYSDCQEVVVAISEFIDSIAGTGTSSVSLLKEYYNLLNNVHVQNNNIELLQQQLSKVINSIKSEFNIKRVEIAFLSYKASMSDSIESIYLAAKDNPNCNAYFIPIPYYDKNADGSLGKIHYEGREYYDKYIEITDWQEYNIEERHPDIIFTFAPYDDVNKITMVHPNYHCKHLKKFTNLLCYIPYYVHVEEEKVSDIRKYVLSNGVCLSNLVFLQSSYITQIYREVLQNYFKLNDQFVENKIIDLGSPKFDKSITASKANYCLPDNWKKLIENKKVIFYNTTIDTFLRNSNQYLQKLRSVFEFFENCDSAIIIWRPHPLLEQTISTMQPELYSEWVNLLNYFKTKNFGIFDDTSDMYQAISVSDGYYGDLISSVQTIYQLTGKPILIQDMNCQAYTNFNISNINLISTLFLESDNQIRIVDFVKILDELSTKNKFRQEVFQNKYTNSDGTAGKKILDYVLSKII